MKRIVRLTESDIHRIVANSIGRIIEQRENYDLIKMIVSAIKEQYAEGIDARENDKNELQLDLADGRFVWIGFNVYGNAYVDTQEGNYDVPEYSEVVDNPEITDITVEVFDENNEPHLLEDTALIENTIKQLLNIDYYYSDL